MTPEPTNAFPTQVHSGDPRTDCNAKAREPTEAEQRGVRAFEEDLLQQQVDGFDRIAQIDTLSVVRAVIRSLREPTAEVVGQFDFRLNEEVSKNVWRAAIDAASPEIKP